MAAEIERFAGRTQADGYLRLRDWLTRLYEVEFDGFIAANFDSPLSLLTPQLARLAALGGFRRWDAVVRRFITDERLRRVFTFQALYAGVPPQRALAVYAVIAYMDTVCRRVLPARRDAGAARRAGRRGRRCGRRIPLRRNGVGAGAQRCDGSPPCAPPTASGSPADAVVLTTELPDTYRLLGRTPRRPLPLRPAPSAVVAHVGCRAVGADVGHHTIVFGDAWQQTFRDIIDDGTLMGDPSLLVTRPTAGDPSLAPPGRDLLYVLAPAPNTGVGHDGLGLHRRPAFAEQMLDTVTDRLPALGVDAEVLRRRRPRRTGRVRAWRRAPRSRWPTPSARPARSARPTPCGVSTTWCWPGRRRCPGSGCPTALCPAGWPPTASPASPSRADRHPEVVHS